MGVEHYLVCGECKEYIDLHKAYIFSRVIHKERPAPGKPSNDFDDGGMDYDDFLGGGYWESRGLWFLWKHRSHKNIKMMYDSNDDWYLEEPYLKEVFPHNCDLVFRKKLENK